MLGTKSTSILVVALTALILLLPACGQAAPSTATSAPLSIATNSLPDGQVGIIYSQTLKASGGSGALTWSISEGSLPQGLSLATKGGSINGMSNTPGTFKFTVQVTDGSGTASQQLSVTFKSSVMPIFIETVSPLEGGEVGIAYTRTISATGGSGAYSWAVTEGALPDGLKLDQNGGIISGTPGRDGVFNFTVQAKDNAGASRDQIFTMTIRKTLSITTSSLSDGQVGTDYEQSVESFEGFGAIRWSITAGSLPDGLTLEQVYGDISGTPTTAGTFNFTVSAKDTLGAVATKDLAITITK
jgi:large repetitive protein